MITWQQRIRVLLDKRNITQTELAEKLGVTKATVSVWLREEATLTEKNIDKLQRRIAPVLGVTPDYIRDGHESETSPGLFIPDQGRSVPHLSGSDISHWHLNKTVANTVPWMYCPIDCSEEAFCYTIPNKVMENGGGTTDNLPYKSLVFVDPKLSLEYETQCLFYDQTPIIGTYGEHNGKSYLVYSNVRFNPVQVVRDNYIGRVIGYFYGVNKSTQAGSQS
ncbi:helix-turn-helix domain-containing protein [Endozoicomonas sp. SESOKO1]|uniref:helix-turn-helix domain-containing protein n=1 Tax=Endozoicomonas sp. SESOKO1 TaxID=2828742 RepID=UPI002148BF94|nr:helix-turn-helix transcriptional regulator [Endozoicomonas sp. SESOKO1]